MNCGRSRSGSALCRSPAPNKRESAFSVPLRLSLPFAASVATNHSLSLSSVPFMVTFTSGGQTRHTSLSLQLLLLAFSSHQRPLISSASLSAFPSPSLPSARPTFLPFPSGASPSLLFQTVVLPQLLPSSTPATQGLFPSADFAPLFVQAKPLTRFEPWVVSAAISRDPIPPLHLAIVQILSYRRPGKGSVSTLWFLGSGFTQSRSGVITTRAACRISVLSDLRLPNAALSQSGTSRVDRRNASRLYRRQLNRAWMAVESDFRSGEAGTSPSFPH
jgi:hypothetical protein